jgi:hypothetical protein
MELSKKKLSEMYYSMTNRELAGILGVCPSYVTAFIRKHGIKPKGKSFRVGRPVIKIVD